MEWEDQEMWLQSNLRCVNGPPEHHALISSELTESICPDSTEHFMLDMKFVPVHESESSLFVASQSGLSPLPECQSSLLCACRQLDPLCL